MVVGKCKIRIVLVEALGISELNQLELNLSWVTP